MNGKLARIDLATGCSGGPLPGGSRADARRQKVIETARALFAGQGFHATGVAQIAKDSGVLVGQIYRDFASKEDIVAAIVEYDMATFLPEELIDAIHRGDREAARHWVVGFIHPDKSVDDCKMVTEIIAESARNPRIAAIFGTIHRGLRARLLAALVVLAPGDAVAVRREAVADALMTLSVGLMYNRVATPETDYSQLSVMLHCIINRELDALVEAAA